MRSLLLFVLALAVWPLDLSADFQAGFDAYERGDYTTALEEWRPLAEQGVAKAQYNLGLMYHNGYGVPQDHAEAVKWYRLAAEQGYAKAQYNLGLMYKDGKGGRQDYVQAYAWFNVAAAQGNEHGVSNRDMVLNDLTAVQVAEAQALSREMYDRLVMVPRAKREANIKKLQDMRDDHKRQAAVKAIHERDLGLPPIQISR